MIDMTGQKGNSGIRGGKLKTEDYKELYEEMSKRLSNVYKIANGVERNITEGIFNPDTIGVCKQIKRAVYGRW